MKFSEIWYIDAFQHTKCYKKTFFGFWLFFAVFLPFWPFLTKKQQKLTKNEENWQNLNRLMKFSEIWFVDASQQKKCYKKIIFWISAFFGRFLTKKQPKLTKNEENWQNQNCLMKFSEIWYLNASKQKKIKKTIF